MKIENTLKHLAEQVTSLLNKKRVSIKYKIFIGVGLFVILNIIINILIVKVSINDIYLGLEKRELKKEYSLINNNINNENELVEIIYNASNNGIRIKILDNDFNLLYNVFSDNMNKRFTNFDLVLLDSLSNNESKIVTLKNYNKDGYDIHLVGKTTYGYVIISSSVESIKKDAKTTMIVITMTSVITFGVLILISYFISKLFSRKIKEIKDVTDDITRLNFNKKIEVKENDELGDLFNNINNMSEELEESIKKLEDANKKLKQELIEKEKKEVARKKLIANISHEFKTPLTIISGYTQLIKEDIKDDENLKNADLIINESERLSDLVREFLELSRLESGNIFLNKENINFNELIEEELDKLSVRINKKKVNVETKLTKDDIVNADKKQITRVIENVLTNGVKFCKKEKIIKIKTYVKDGYFYYEVFNSGDNIKDKDKENIFNSYYKDKSTRNKEGTGLGLTIVKAIVNLHDGTCVVKNVKDGVNFIIGIKK